MLSNTLETVPVLLHISSHTIYEYFMYSPCFLVKTWTIGGL